MFWGLQSHEVDRRMIWYLSIMAIIFPFLGLCSLVIIFVCLFVFSGGWAAATFPKFSSKLLLFFISRSNLWFFMCHPIILSYAVCCREIGGKTQTILLTVLPKNYRLFFVWVHFLVVSPIYQCTFYNWSIIEN